MSADEIKELRNEVAELKELVLQLARPVEALGNLVIEANSVTKIKGLNKNTISANDNLEKYQEKGKRKILISLESVPVIKNRKRAKTRAR